MTTEKQIEKIFKKWKKKIVINTGYIYVDMDLFCAYKSLEYEIKNLLIK